jgi:broad specificity polyphosphatase/5'/3'-nucleotidase SurE
MRWMLALAGTIAAHLATAAPPSPPAAPAGAALCGDGPLEILLTNDDGFESPGIRALYTQLKAAGHRVRLVAPARNASGTSSSFTWGKVAVTRDPRDPDVFGVEGTPATTVVLGATALYPEGRRPDLVISGINDGTNTGSVLVISGTIGAALAGTMLLDPPVPGLAVNAERAGTADARQVLPPQHLEQVATHVTRLVASTRGWFCDGGRLATIAGVRVATQGRTTDLHLDFQPVAEGVYDSVRLAAPSVPDDDNSDNVLLRAGFVTVTPLTPSLAARDVPAAALQQRLGK